MKTLLSGIAALTCLMATALALHATPAMAATSEEELARQTQNPIANLISVPLQYNQDYGIGPADAQKRWLNVQPVIPISLNQDWNLITRTIIPLIDAESPLPGGPEKAGMGDINPSFFFTPVKEYDGWMIGAGPVLLFPTATRNTLGTEKFAAGPTLVALKQQSGFTYGVLANHLWSYAGNESRTEVNSTFLQPFFAFTTKTYTTFGLNTESTYDWKDSQWTVPVNFSLTQMLKVAGQPLTLQAGYRYYAEKPDGGPDWGLRFALTLLFPK